MELEWEREGEKEREMISFDGRLAGVSGDDGTKEQHAEHVVCLALDIRAATKNNYKCSPYRKICIRIAVNTGVLLVKTVLTLLLHCPLTGLFSV